MVEVGGIARERLKSFIERIENLEEEKTALTADIREIYSEAKGIGLDIKTLRQIVRLRKLDSSDRQQQEELLALYKKALGMYFYHQKFSTQGRTSISHDQELRC